MRLKETDVKLSFLIIGDTCLQKIGIPLNCKIIETPGHTMDSVSILFDDGDCLIGDAAANFLQLAGTKYCVIFICNLGTYYKSWEKIIGEGARLLFLPLVSCVPILNYWSGYSSIEHSGTIVLR